MSKDTALAGLRKAWALTQHEVGSLLNVSSDSIGRYEAGDRDPALLAAIGLEMLFGVSLAAVFPEHATEAASQIVAGLAALSIKIEGSETPAHRRQRQFITEVSARVEPFVP